MPIVVLNFKTRLSALFTPDDLSRPEAGNRDDCISDIAQAHRRQEMVEEL